MKTKVISDNFEITQLQQTDYNIILENIEDYWEVDEEKIKKIKILHHPIFLYQFVNTCFVIKKKFNVIAYLFGFFSQKETDAAYIHMIATHKNQRNNGYAKKLFSHFENISRENKKTCIKAITSPSNKESINFHQKIGMLPQKSDTVENGICIQKDYSGLGNHMVLISKKI
ncbi:MAG: GNAT family N-acetyltransferase [Leptospirales bacterium]